jgi:thiol-disulfide isomerase/thioredoxin
MRKFIFAVGLSCAALAFCAGAAATLGADKGAAQKQEATKPAASNSAASNPSRGGASEARPKVTEIKGDELKSLLAAGGARERPLLVNFWATWCEPCREEFPDLVKIRGQYAADKLDFVVISLDDLSDIDKAVPDFLTEVHAASMPAYLLHTDDDGAAINMVDSTWSGELPATFLYDRTGNVVFKHKGRIKPDELRAALDQTLGAKPQ